MVNFRDVARNIERRSVQSALNAIPRESLLSQGIARTGGPQNQSAPNHDLDAPVIAPDGTPLTLLRANAVNIGDGVLAA